MFWGEPYCQECQYVGPELMWMWHHGIGVSVLLRNMKTHDLRVVEIADHPAFYKNANQTDETRTAIAYLDSALAKFICENEERIASSRIREWEFEKHGLTDLICPRCGSFLKWRGKGIS